MTATIKDTSATCPGDTPTDSVHPWYSACVVVDGTWFGRYPTVELFILDYVKTYPDDPRPRLTRVIGHSQISWRDDCSGLVMLVETDGRGHTTKPT